MTPKQHSDAAKPRILLTSVFGPYTQDDEYGSRAINPMELYHNQVTRLQGPFSLRMFHRSWGIMMIQANIDAPSTVLDFPDQERFIREIRENQYDIVGISSIVANIGKVKRMCQIIRRYQPQCRIVVGGHIANLPGLSDRIDADHIVQGDGIAWFRRHLGQDESAPIHHPEILSGFGGRIMGIPLRKKPGDTAAVLIPSVGCPVGCNFCSTSAMFGGKGKHIDFFHAGEELFRVMSRLEKNLKVHSFFVMDENFLLHRKRALELLGLMKEHGKAWSLYVFTSARVLQSYSMEELVGLGISWVWMGLEGEDSSYPKLRDVDTFQLVRRLQENGIRVLGSSIIGLENHTPENIDQVITHAVAHDTDFHQFMLYTPVPGTPLYAEHQRAGTMLPGIDEADIHGQYRFNFRHPAISPEQSEHFLLRAFRRDYETNGPSLLRIMRTTLLGWKRHGKHEDRRVRSRYHRDLKNLMFVHPATLWAMEKYFELSHPELALKARALRAEFRREFGRVTTLTSALVGRFLRWTIRREDQRLAQGWTYQPATFVERVGWDPAVKPASKGAVERVPGRLGLRLPDAFEAPSEG